MSRDIEKVVKQVTGKINPYYDITILDLQYLQSRLYEENAIAVIVKAFKFGYVMGQRATKAEAKKQASK